MGTTMASLSGAASSCASTQEATVVTPPRGVRQGPGRWCMLETGEPEKPLEERALGAVMQAVTGSIPADAIWSDPDRPTRGGITPMSYLHATMLIRLNDADHLDALRDVAAATQPFVLTVSDIYVSKVGRLSTEFGYDIYSLGISYQSMDVIRLKREWTACVGAATGHSPPALPSPSDARNSDGAAGADSEQSEYTRWLEDMQQTHDPYKNAGHSSLAYIRASGLEAAEALREELLAKHVGEQGVNNINVPITKFGVKHPGNDQVEWIMLSPRS